MRFSRCCFVLLALFVAVSTVSAQTTSIPSGISRVTSIEGVTEYQLPNGLHVLLVPDTSKPTVTVNVTYLVGSRHESYGETGMAHLLEHMLFKGSTNHPHIPDEISTHGAQTNASTSYDRTNYFETFAASAENLDWALGLESDRMVNSFIAKKDLDSEMTVVRNEFEGGENNPIGVLSERVHETAYLWHNYGHPTIGARSDIEKVPIEHLQAFYHTYYQPDNAYLVVAGKFDEGKTVTLIQQKFGSIPRPHRVLAPPYTEEPTQDGQREVLLRRVGDVEAVVAAYHIPADGHPDTIALNLLAQILSDPASGRLRKRLVDTKLATGASAELMSQYDPGLMQFFVEMPKGGNLEAARKDLLKLVEGIPQEPIPQEELDRAKAQLLDGFEKQIADPASVVANLSEAVAVGDWRLLFWERDQSKTVTVEDLSRVAAKYLVPSNLTMGIFLPEEQPVRATIPQAPDYQAVLRDYTGNQAIEEGEQFDATPANIESRTVRSTAGPIKLALLPKKTRGSLVNVVLRLEFGDEKSLRNLAMPGFFSANLLMRGTARHEMTALSDTLTANKTEMSAGGGASEVQVSILTDREHVARALGLAREVLREPSFPEKEFEELKQQLLTQLESSRSEPSAIADRALRRTLSAYPREHLAYVPTLDESIARTKATTLEDVKKFYRDFYGIGTAEASFVGDFDVEEAKRLMKELFADWKSPAHYERVASLYKQVRPDTKSFNTPDKENSVFLAGTNLALRDDDPNYPALVIGNYILGGGFLNSRLSTRIRQEEGLSYSVGSRLEASALDKAGSFRASAICAPQNGGKVARAFDEELSRALTAGFTAEEVTAAKSGYLQSRQVDLSDDGTLASVLADQLFVGRDFHWEEQYQSSVKALTAEAVSSAMKKFIDPKSLVVISAGDFSKTAEKE